MADGQGSAGDLEHAQASQEDPNNNSAAANVDQEALQTAKSELQQKMAEVTDNPPTEQPPPPSVNAADDMYYMEPAPDPFNKAITYLEQHNILQIFQNMTANIIYQKPENPVEFMISEIAEMKKQRDSGPAKK
ncbi:hypothetical protein BaRGS_00023799 [Batillaria attramentaria]|uniref:Uncharacterized protein n=1 Tax=Batillaria attramentaria TaxID=370345 RepID=A0ABD0KCZ3_9CAEN